MTNSKAYIGILDNLGFNYIEVYQNTLPSIAYPILKNQYQTIPQILHLFQQHQSTNKLEPMADRQLNHHMRYSIKNFVLSQKEPPAYVYVYNTRVSKWYCFDTENRGFTSFSKLEQLVQSV
jgi:hypothetical protein